MAEDASPPSREPPRWRGRLQAPLVSLAYVVVLAGTIWLFVAFPMPTAKSISCSDFLQQVRADQISEVVIDAHRIRGATKGGGQTFETTRIEDPRLDGARSHRGRRSASSFASGLIDGASSCVTPSFWESEHDGQ